MQKTLKNLALITTGLVVGVVIGRVDKSRERKNYVTKSFDPETGEFKY